MLGNDYLLWENDAFLIKTPSNPHISYSEGPHLIVISKVGFENAWSNPEIASEAFKISAKACKIMETQGVAPWFNIQANGNWALLSEGPRFFHLHVYGRNQTQRWGKPIALPELPHTYQHEPMPEYDRDKLIEAFRALE